MLGAGECRMFEMLKYNCSVILETGDSITQRYTRHQAAGGLQEGGGRHRQQVWHLNMAISMTRGTLLTGTVRAADIFWSMLDSDLLLLLLLLLLDNYLHKTVMLFRSSIPDIVQTTVDIYITYYQDCEAGSKEHQPVTGARVRATCCVPWTQQLTWRTAASLPPPPYLPGSQCGTPTLRQARRSCLPACVKSHASVRDGGEGGEDGGEGDEDGGGLQRV